MKERTEFVRQELLSAGADMVGFGDVTGLPAGQRGGMPVGIAVAVRYSKEVIKGIRDLPTKQYFDEYNEINEKLDRIVRFGEELIQGLGYEAVAQSMEFVSQFRTGNGTRLPHKTVATRAGLGWIGKCALLVTEECGSMLRLSSILTNAPLDTAKPINSSRCGNCMVCRDVCPGQAVLGKNWDIHTYRDTFYNGDKCNETAKQRSVEGFGLPVPQCGLCILSCPHTQKYLNESG